MYSRPAWDPVYESGGGCFMKKLITVALTGMLAASFVMSASAAETIKIGGIGPITGAAAIYGSNVKNGMDQSGSSV